MRDLILFGLLMILLLVAQFATAKTIDEVIEKYIRALGGKDKLALVKSIYLEGVNEMKGKELRVKIIKEQDKLSRTEFESSDANGFMLVTDKEGWRYFSQGPPAAEKISEDDLAGLQIEMDIAGPLPDYISKGHKAELMGKEMVDGNNCYKINLTTKAGKRITFWLDTHTYLVSQSFGLPICGENAATYTMYRNYKEIEGIRFAYTCQTKNMGREESEITGEINFYKILINPAIDPKMYQPF